MQLYTFALVAFIPILTRHTSFSEISSSKLTEVNPRANTRSSAGIPNVVPVKQLLKAHEYKTDAVTGSCNDYRLKYI